MSMNDILSTASSSQIEEMMNTSDDDTLQHMFLRLAMAPSNNMKNLVSKINDALSQDSFVAKHSSFGSTNIIVNLPKTIYDVSSISVLSMYGRYELALMNSSGSLKYIQSIGYDFCLPSFDTSTDVIIEIRRIYSELQKLNSTICK
jgi:hypothetical protein